MYISEFWVVIIAPYYSLLLQWEKLHLLCGIYKRDLAGTCIHELA